MFRPWLVLVGLLTITVFYQNCGSPAGGGDQAPAPQKTQTLAVDQTLATEVVSYLTLNGTNWQSLTDEDIIREVIEQLENVVSGLPAGTNTRTRIEEILELLRSSAELRALVVTYIREGTYVAPTTPTPTPTPASTAPTCLLDVNPFTVDRTVANSLTFSWTSQNTKFATFKYWDGSTQMAKNVGNDGSLSLALRANFSPRPDIIPFNVQVVSPTGVVGKCTIFVEFK